MNRETEPVNWSKRTKLVAGAITGLVSFIAAFGVIYTSFFREEPKKDVIIHGDFVGAQTFKPADNIYIQGRPVAKIHDIQYPLYLYVVEGTDSIKNKPDSIKDNTITRKISHSKPKKETIGGFEFEFTEMGVTVNGVYLPLGERKKIDPGRVPFILIKASVLTRVTVRFSNRELAEIFFDDPTPEQVKNAKDLVRADASLTLKTLLGITKPVIELKLGKSASRVDWEKENNKSMVVITGENEVLADVIEQAMDWLRQEPDETKIPRTNLETMMVNVRGIITNVDGVTKNIEMITHAPENAVGENEEGPGYKLTGNVNSAVREIDSTVSEIRNTLKSSDFGEALISIVDSLRMLPPRVGGEVESLRVSIAHSVDRLSLMLSDKAVPGVVTDIRMTLNSLQVSLMQLETILTGLRENRFIFEEGKQPKSLILKANDSK